MEKEIKGRLVQIKDKFHCEFIEYVFQEDLDETKQILISDEDRLAIGQTKCFDVENNCVVDYDNTEDLKKQHLQELRAKRVPLLKAFDVYKSSVAYGTEIETEDQRVKMMTWYNLLLALDEDAMKEENIPERVKYYL